MAAQLGGSLSGVTYYVTYRNGVLYSYEYVAEISIDLFSTVTVTSVVTLQEE